MTKRPWLWLAGFILVWLGFRIFWLDGDPGITSLWEYGFNVTDEGYYMGAGKDKFLWGGFCDFARNESFTYGYSPLTHWFSYVAYRVVGLSDWVWRVPFFLLYLSAWIMSFRYVGRRLGGRTAFLWCASLSLAPVMVAYERTACNDLAIASLGVIAYCLASGKGVWRIFGAAFVTGAIVLVKPSVWVVLPIVAAGILSERKTRYAWLDLALFVGSAFVAVWGWKSLALLSLIPEVERHGMTATEVIRRTTTHNALPSLLDYDQLLRGFSSFPRDICFLAMSGLAVFVSAVPLAMAGRDAVHRRWTWRVVLYLGVLAYVAGISVNNSICLHYYHPVLFLLPILMCEVVQDLRLQEDFANASWKVSLGVLTALMGCVGLIMLTIVSPTVKPQIAIEYFSNISNLPKRIVWGYNGGWLLSVSALVIVALAYVRGVRAFVREGVIWALCGFAVASVALANLATPSVARYVRLQASNYVPVMGVVLVVGMCWLVTVFGSSGTLRIRLLAWLIPSAIVVSYAFTPSWRSAAVELVRPAAHVQRTVASEVVKLLPENAVVIGERSTQVLMGTPLRTATTMPGCNPIPIVQKLLEENSSCPIYGLLDSQNAYNLQHFQKHAKEYRLMPINTFKMPSFMNGRPADVYLCRVEPIRPKGK